MANDKVFTALHDLNGKAPEGYGMGVNSRTGKTFIRDEYGKWSPVMVALTQAEYDALLEKNEYTLYLITA